MMKIYTSANIFLRAIPLLFFSFSLLPHGIAQPIISFSSIINGTVPAGGAVQSPIDIVNAGDGSNRLFVVQQGGIIKVFNQSPVSFIGNFLTVGGITAGGEQGLLSMAFPPDYSSSGYFFVYYTNTAGDIELARYHTPAGTPNTADPASKEVLLTIPHPGQTNHNGGKLNFGADGYLYFATGDGGGGGDVPNNAQNGTVLLGKMLRINVNTTATGPLYTIPADNPFLAPGDNIRDEIWAFGLRNPFRWSFDRLTHDMWIADVGQGAWEEINFRPDGSTGNLNYEWHCKEGLQDYNGGCALVAGTGTAAPPLFDYPHNNATGGFAVIGGYVYRGTQQPAMAGYYIFADEVSSNVWILPPNGTVNDTVEFRALRSQISSFGEGEDGELFATTLNGEVHLVIATASAALPVKLLGFKGSVTQSYNELSWQTADEVQLRQYEVEYSPDGLQFEQAGIVAAAGTGGYTFRHLLTPAGKMYYRLKMVDIDGKSEYSKIIVLSAAAVPGKNFVLPSVVINGSMDVLLDAPYQLLQVMNMDGRIVYRQSVNNRTGKITLQLPPVPAGQYLVRLVSADKQLTQKIIVR